MTAPDGDVAYWKREAAAAKARIAALEDKAMWVVKNFGEWSDSDTWAGEPFETLAASIAELEQALAPVPAPQEAGA